MRRDKEVNGQYMSKQMAESCYGLIEQTNLCDKEGMNVNRRYPPASDNTVDFKMTGGPSRKHVQTTNTEGFLNTIVFQCLTGR